MKIPIQNIYYILSYAWNKLQESKIVNISEEDYEHIYDLLSQVLINGCHHLFKRGLDRNYINTEEAYPGIKGKIIFDECLKYNLFKQGKAFCSFDEFDHDVLHNQIIKATLKRLTKIKDLDFNLKKKVWKTYWRFENISEIDLDLSKFQSVKIHRNNYFYDFLIKICKLIIINTAPDEKDGNYVFKDFIRDDTLMRPVFEEFVRNFYALEAPKYKVRREDIYWIASPIEDSDISYLPKMQTDISLESSERKIIIDTKFSAKTLSHHYESEKIKSENLYQIYSYLRNIEQKEKHPFNSHSEGILLYPTVLRPFDQSFQMGNHKIRISTVNLAGKWRSIHNRLIHLVE